MKYAIPDLYEPFEFWEKIEGYDNYFISSNGRVLNMNKCKYLKARYSNKGYKYVDLHKNGIAKRYYIHRLVAISFILNFNEKYNQIDHIDNNRQNNCFYNLRWTNNTINNINKKKFISKACGIQFDRIYHNWSAKWNENGKTHSKSFSADKYGYENAKNKASEYRLKMIRTLPNYIEALRYTNT